MQIFFLKHQDSGHRWQHSRFYGTFGKEMTSMSKSGSFYSTENMDTLKGAFTGRKPKILAFLLLMLQQHLVVSWKVLAVLNCWNENVMINSWTGDRLFFFSDVSLCYFLFNIQWTHISFLSKKKNHSFKRYVRLYCYSWDFFSADEQKICSS